MLRVALVGVGGISGSHLPAWSRLEGVTLVGICDIRPEQMERFRDTIHCNFYTDFDEMMEQEQFDILDICLPTYLHAAYAKKAMERDIHVLCEKPISLRREDVDMLYETARKQNVKFMIAQVLRFWPEYSYVKECFDAGTFGKFLSGTMKRLGKKPTWSWEDWMFDKERSGLVPFDLHIHDLDFMVYAFGRPAEAKQYRARNEEQDYLHAVYDYGEFFISCSSSWYAADYPFSAEFLFQFEKALVAYEKGVLTVYENDKDPYVCQVDGGQSTGQAINLPSTDAYFNEIQYFADCVKNDRWPDKVKQEELEAVIEILQQFE